MIFDIHTHQLKADSPYKIIRSIFPEQIPSLEDSELFTVGLHPWHINSNWPQVMEQVVEAAARPNCLAIGECGLDRICETDPELQLQVFQASIELADRLNKPLIVHCVKYYPELIGLRKKLLCKNNWLLHGFRTKSDIARQLLKDKNIYFSLGAYLTFSTPAQNMLKKLPLHRIMFETDEAEIDIKEIYRTAAEMLDRKDSEFEKVIEQNISNFFGRKI